MDNDVNRWVRSFRDIHEEAFAVRVRAIGKRVGLGNPKERLNFKELARRAKVDSGSAHSEAVKSKDDIPTSRPEP